MIRVKLYLIQGFLEFFVAPRAGCHSKSWSQCSHVCGKKAAHRNLRYYLSRPPSSLSWGPAVAELRYFTVDSLRNSPGQLAEFGLRNSPVHGLEMAIWNHPCRVRPPKNKKLPCAGQGQEHSVLLFHHGPIFCLITFICVPSVGTKEKIYPWKSILWIFQDPLVIRLNQTAREIMRSIGILVEHSRGSIFQSTQGQERLGEDWE